MAKQQKQAKKQPAAKGSQSQHKGKTGSTGKQTRKKKTDLEFPLGKENFILMGIGFAIIIIGYILMSGDKNIYDFRKTTLSVIVVMFGYAFEIYAIMKTPKSNKDNEQQE